MKSCRIKLYKSKRSVLKQKITLNYRNAKLTAVKASILLF
jgi:hypothetical protein